MSLKRITIKEIAKRAGVSIGTVDRVLHNRGEVAEETRKRVLKIAREGNYRTNVYARSLKLNKTYSIGVLIPDDNEYWLTLKSGISDKANEYYSLGIRLVFFTYNRKVKESFPEQSSKLKAAQLDAVILAPVFEKKTRAICTYLEKQHVPYVFVESNIMGAGTLSFIGPQSFQAGKLAARLLTIGYTGNHPVYILRYEGFDNENKTLDERIAGFKDYFLHKGWPKEYICDLTVKESENGDFVREELENLDSVYLFVPNSRAHQASEQLGFMKKTKDFRLVGFDAISKNIEYLREGSIDFIIDQNPFNQGSKSISALYEHFILGQVPLLTDQTSLEIKTLENL